jgi:hypothetical protein
VLDEVQVQEGRVVAVFFVCLEVLQNDLDVLGGFTCCESQQQSFRVDLEIDKQRGLELLDFGLLIIKRIQIQGRLMFEPINHNPIHKRSTGNQSRDTLHTGLNVLGLLTVLEGSGPGPYRRDLTEQIHIMVLPEPNRMELGLRHILEEVTQNVETGLCRAVLTVGEEDDLDVGAVVQLDGLDDVEEGRPEGGASSGVDLADGCEAVGQVELVEVGGLCDGVVDDQRDVIEVVLFEEFYHLLDAGFRVVEGASGHRAASVEHDQNVLVVVDCHELLVSGGGQVQS